MDQLARDPCILPESEYDITTYLLLRYYLFSVYGGIISVGASRPEGQTVAGGRGAGDTWRSK